LIEQVIMSDYLLQEIDEELRADRLKAFWKKHGMLVAIVAVLFVLLIVGWRGYNSWQQSHAARDGDILTSALRATETGASKETEQKLTGLAASGTKGAATLARFRLAADAERLNGKQKAMASFDELAADSSLQRPLRDLARVRAAWLALEAHDRKGVSARVEQLAESDGPMRHSARELLALAAYQEKDLNAASRWFNAIISDPASPPELRSRGEIMISLLEAEGVSASQEAGPKE
jgi:hypothetical protein